MSRPNPITKNRNGYSETSGHKIYAWIVATSAVLLLGLLIWPLSVNRFEATSVFQFRYEPTSGIEKTSLNEMVVQTLRDQTERQALAQIFSNLDATLSSDVLQTMDPEQIRQAIKVQGRPGDSTNSVEYRMSFVGEGSPDEIEFLNELVSRINHNLPNRLAHENHTEVVNRLTQDYGEFYDGQLRIAGNQLTDVINDLSTFDNDLKIVQGDLKSITADGMSSAPAFARPTNNTLNDLNRLVAERDRLMQNGANQYHPHVMAVRKKIERLKMAAGTANFPTRVLPDPNMPPPNGQFQVGPRGNAAVIKNRFVSQKSNTPAAPQIDPMVQLAAPLGRVIDDIKMIDLTGTKTALSQIQNTIENTSASKEIAERLNRRAVSELQFESPVALARIDVAERSSPMQRAPNMTQFIWMLGFAGLVGTVMALNFDPAFRTRRFRSVEQVSRKLSLPVVGILRGRKNDQPAKPLAKVLAANGVRICEWTLLGLAVLLILAALVNSHVAAAFIENPFHGITKTFWLMTGR